MSYGDDFASVDTAGAPLDPTVMIGADPFFWGAVLLALAAALLAGLYFGARSGNGRPDAATAIWKAIDAAATAAMKADTEALPARAADLDRVLRARLGKTLGFGSDLTGRVDALHLALEGEREVGDGDGHVAHDRSPEEETPAADRDAAAPSSSAAAAVTIVSIHSPATRSAPPSPRPDRRPMNTRERNRALRLAVADFNDYWRHRSVREADMRAVVAELCDPGPPPPRAGRGGGHH